VLKYRVFLGGVGIDPWRALTHDSRYAKLIGRNSSWSSKARYILVEANVFGIMLTYPDV